MNATDLTVRSMHFAGGIFEKMIADLSPQDLLHRPTKGANCAAWILGHLILAHRSMMKSLGGVPKTELPADFETRFSQKEGCPDRDEYGDTASLPALFKATHDELTAHIESLSQDQLAQQTPKPHPMFKTLGDLAALAPIHVATHSGHLSTIRRSLGRPPLF